jgi:cellulose synthase/poly-beta-1,6-N-acetylglucosamine synthase-like glycosyltransferase
MHFNLSQISDLSPFTIFILALFIFSFVVQLIYWCFLFSKLAFFKSSPKLAQHRDRNEKPVSIIICARNEAKNLEKNLPRILTQNYRSFEVVVVNDNSDDTTYDVLIKYKKIYSNLQVINLDAKPLGMVGKKFPLKIGIESSKYTTLLLTDADCRPSTSEWLFYMQSRISDTTKIVLGYGPYTFYPSLLNRFIRFETVYTAIQYFSFALAKLPYMGVGRNLAYRKELFTKSNGFEEHKHIASGDDDLFINKVATGENVSIMLEKESFVYSEPKTTWRDNYRQKARHLSTETSYQLKHQILLGTLSASHFLFYVTGIILYVLDFYLMFGTLFGIRYIMLVFYYGKILKRFQEKRLLLWIPILDFMYILYYITFTPILFFRKTIQWK